jgi:hypothetical protein
VIIEPCADKRLLDSLAANILVPLVAIVIPA